MDDLISRKAAINACYDGWNIGSKEISANIKKLPSAQPKPYQTIEIKPCPFCGGKAKLIQKAHGSQNSPTRITNSYVVGCAKCDIFTRYYPSNIWQGEDGVVNIDANGAIDAILAWNKRAGDLDDKESLQRSYKQTSGY